jgi:hypothetical protein
MHAKDLVTPEYLHERLSLDKDSGLIFWKHSNSVPKNWNTKYAGKEAGLKTLVDGYRVVNILNKPYKVHRVVWAMIHGEWPAIDIDHIDGRRTNNAISNLRLAGSVMNHGNMIINRSNNTSGYKGVSWDKRQKKWRASIKVHKQAKKLGAFSSKHDAAEAYNRAAVAGFGVFAKINMIDRSIANDQ